MIYFVTGASGAGKSACLPHLRALLPTHALHDFDAVGVPADATKHWRQETTEHWIRTAREEQRQTGRDTVVCGGAILGEVLVAPSLDDLDAFALCLLDCSDVVRVERLRARGDGAATQDMLNWAAWQRVHCVDPTWSPHTIRDGASAMMRWERWHDWTRDHARWRVEVAVIDTTLRTPPEVARAVAAWVRARGGHEVRTLDAGDVEALGAAFPHKRRDRFAEYLENQRSGRRTLLLARRDGVVLGYLAIDWHPVYAPFRADGIPEIQDLDVVPAQRRGGVASALLQQAERRVAARSDRVGIAVGLDADYGPAQILYARRGYVPDGRGVSAGVEPVTHGDRVAVDDDLVLRLVKRLDARPAEASGAPADAPDRERD